MRKKNILAGKKILVMDDEAEVREVLSRMLQKLGCKTATSSDGHQAVVLYKKAKESGSPFDAAILDITVPGGLGGKETLDRLLEIDPGVKAIVSSGYSDDPVMTNYRQNGFAGIVEKPYRLQELQEVVCALFGRQEK